MRNRIFFPFYKPRHKALTGPKLTNSKSQILHRASDGYRLEPMPRHCRLTRRRRVPTAPRRLVRAEPSWRVPASAVSPCGGARSDWRGRIYARLLEEEAFKIIEWLKQAGEGARGVFKALVACRLKFRKQMVLIDRSGRICTRELKEEALRND